MSGKPPAITFHHLPIITLPPGSSTVIENLAFDLPRLDCPNIRQALETISSQKSALIKAFVIDFFCNAAFDVSSSLHIPTYFFYTSGAFALSIFLYLPTLHETITTSLKDLRTYLEFPATPPIYCLDMPKVMQDRTTPVYENFISTAKNMAKSSGLIVNTFEALEPRAVKAISAGKCVPNAPLTPVYFIGPLIASSRKGADDANVGDQECLNWLNTQPSKSVVFLCFGSLGTFDAEQLKDMAIGLEKSGNRFLWVVRSPPPMHDATEGSSGSAQPEEPDLDKLLPEGFVERTQGKGLVVKSWAPQVAVLNHDAVGGFVTHCGWNSVLEAICAGVPMVAWPLYAEQRWNRVFMVEEMKVALSLTESEDGFVTAAELEKRVRELMDLDSGKAVREQVAKMKDAAEIALADGGSSRVALEKLIDSWKGRGPQVGSI